MASQYKVGTGNKKSGFLKGLPRVHSSSDVFHLCGAPEFNVPKSLFFGEMVEPRGVEPLTSCMPCKRSPN